MLQQCRQPISCNAGTPCWGATAQTASCNAGFPLLATAQRNTLHPARCIKTRPAKITPDLPLNPTYLEKSCASSTMGVAHTRKKPKDVNIMSEPMFMR